MYVDIDIFFFLFSFFGFLSPLCVCMVSSFGSQIVDYFNIQFERGEALENITQDVRKVLEEECDEESLKLLPKAVDTVRKKVTIPK